ncbi:MAG TPA: CPBP family intramembrane glutamic endopeptidase [Pseudogracilibacillus sp.]|nr:CPBP family intramembrane glutamic endopeptidase [Pseudogracilibacillus sp.]
MRKQSEIIKQMPQSMLRKQLLLSQGIFFIIGILLSIFLFDHMTDWFDILIFNWRDIIKYGVLPAIILVIVEMILYKMLDDSHFDDGGINKKIFQGEQISWIIIITLIVAISEEVLFRGVIQTTFGYIFASSLFAIIHIRYLKKPILFLLVLFTSFLIGYLFLITENLLVTIVFHFLVDLLLGLYVKYTK